MTGRTSPGPWMLMTSLLLAGCVVEPALAQAAHTDPAIRPQSYGNGVLTPPEHVDPGMTRPTPQMPAQSTPVIHPRQLRRTRQGNVLVVPK